MGKKKKVIKAEKPIVPVSQENHIQSASQEIDLLFGAAASQKKAELSHAKELAIEANSASGIQKRKKGIKEDMRKKQEPDDDWLDSMIKPSAAGGPLISPLKFTVEGWPIYQEEEIVSQKGGDTKACPFHCDCCY